MSITAHFLNFTSSASAVAPFKSNSNNNHSNNSNTASMLRGHTSSNLVNSPANIFPSNSRGLTPNKSVIEEPSDSDDPNNNNKVIIINNNNSKRSSKHLVVASTSTESTCKKDNEEMSRRLFHCSVLPPQHQRDHGKLTVVLDIDETLIHARLPDDNYRQEEERLDVLKTEYKGDTFEVTLRQGESFIVNKRPGLDEFLEQASKHFELIAYTAAVEDYAKPLLDKIDPEGKYFRHRLYRSHCVFAKGHFVKDLRVVNRKLDRVVLVDNNAYCFLPQLGNGVPISSFYNDHSDSALNVLLKFLFALHEEKEVQPILRDVFNLERILSRDRDAVLFGHPHFR